MICDEDAVMNGCHCNLIEKDGRCVKQVTNWTSIGASIGGVALVLVIAVVIAVVVLKKKKGSNVKRANFDYRAAAF